ncbi:MAG: RDD family protein [Candidatus Velthaea sp.]
MERTLEVRTGESIAIRYELAGLGSRFLAVSLDIGIQLACTAAVLLLLVVLQAPLIAVVAALHLPVKTLSAVLIAVSVMAVFVIFFGYFIVFELWWSGRTPGKRALGIRVVRDAGFPLDVGGAVIRNLVRAVDVALGLYAVSALVALLSRENKRLGDYAAGTIVVRDAAYSPSVLDEYLVRPTPADDGLAAGDRALVVRYVLRRDALEPHARADLAARLAARVRPQLRADFAHLSDDDLLAHLGRGAQRRD